MVMPTYSATVSVRVTSLPRRQLRCASVSPTEARHPFDQFIIAKTPAGRWGTPEDLMARAVFLASDASNFVNGHVLYVDGGILAYIGKQP